jgi:hypothetical protein
MLKTGFTAARMIFSVLAASMLGMAVLTASATGAASSSTCTSPGNCFTLAFTSDGQPAGTAVGAHITSGFDSSGGAVKVEVLNSLGQVVGGSSVDVTVAIDPGSNPGGGSLSGTTTERAIAGVASFSDLSIDRPGIGYRLTASSPGITSATSAFFTIWGSLKPCSTTPCSASASSSTTTGTITTSSATATEILGDGLGGVSYSCGSSYQRTSDPFSFDVFSSSGLAQAGALFSGTLAISKSTVQASGHTGASSWQICYASTVLFKALAGTSGTETIGGVLYYTGLLPDCSSTQGAPCIEARNKDNAGDVIVTFLASGDPVVWG